MNMQETLNRMKAPSHPRNNKPHAGVLQIHLTRACSLSCYGCTQSSNLGGKTYFITLENFEHICKSLINYPWVIGIFGGLPNLHPKFGEICEILRSYFPKERCGLWSNDLKGTGKICRQTFNPAVSNLNVHLVRSAYEEMLRDWPECRPFGLVQDSRHSPTLVAIKDIIVDEGERWELISQCSVNQRWSSLAGQFRGEPRGWFCEIAGAQSILYQDDITYPDTGFDVRTEFIDENTKKPISWWQLPMQSFSHQVKKHCLECGVMLNGYGELAQRNDIDGKEQVSKTHQNVYKPKRPNRRVELVTIKDQLQCGKITRLTDYLQNSIK